jgi:hypothetical protein
MCLIQVSANNSTCWAKNSFGVPSFGRSGVQRLNLDLGVYLRINEVLREGFEHLFAANSFGELTDDLGVSLNGAKILGLVFGVNGGSEHQAVQVVGHERSRPGAALRLGQRARLRQQGGPFQVVLELSLGNPITVDGHYLAAESSSTRT